MGIKVGDIIYVNSAFYLSHGRDDFVGGKAHVIEVKQDMSGGELTEFVRVKERPDSLQNWGQFLSKEQAELKKRFGNKWAHSSPDMREEFNRDD